jgi:hypothetical protein
MFETFSFLPPLSDGEIARQVDYIVANGWTPCLEFADIDHAYVQDKSQLRFGNSASAVRAPCRFLRHVTLVLPCPLMAGCDREHRKLHHPWAKNRCILRFVCCLCFTRLANLRLVDGKWKRCCPVTLHISFIVCTGCEVAAGFLFSKPMVCLY